MSIRDVLIVGAGPSGLATAIAAKQRGLDYLVVDKGVLVNSIFHFPTHMVYFTTPELLEIGGLPLVTPYDKPTRLESLRYYRRVVDTYQLQISLNEKVVDIAREKGTFAVTTEDVEPSGAVPARRVRHAHAVVLAIGYYDYPNLLGVPGEDLPHVSHYFREPHPYYKQRVVVVGGKNSAAEAALELYRAGAYVTLVHRRQALGESIKYWVRPDIENRIKEGSIAARFNTRVVEIRPRTVVVAPSNDRAASWWRGRASDSPTEEIPADAVLLLTGYHPDADLMRRSGIRCDDESLVPDLNPETFETNVPNLFIAGGAIAGRHTGNIFIENGRFHGERIATVLAERIHRD